MLTQDFISSVEPATNAGVAIAVEELTLADDIQALLRADTVAIP